MNVYIYIYRFFEFLNVFETHLVHVGVEAAVGGARGEAQRHLAGQKRRCFIYYTRPRHTCAAKEVYAHTIRGIERIEGLSSWKSPVQDGDWRIRSSIRSRPCNLTLAPAACGPACTRIRRKLRRLKSRGVRASGTYCSSRLSSSCPA